MTTDGTAPGVNDALIVRDLEEVYRQVQAAVAAGASPERTGVLNSLQLMLEQSVRAARLLVDNDAMQVAQ
jgi:hypothetical protein